jgi:hypothetical protein
MTTPTPSDKPRTATEMVEGVVDTVSREASEKAAAVRDLYNDHIYGKQANATRDMAKKASKWTWGKGGEQIISEDTASKTIPFVTGAIATGVGMLLLEPAKWVMEKTFGLLKNVVTGFGLLPKIPLIGKVFEWLGDGLETIGKYAGYAIPAIAGFIGYSMFKDDRQFSEAGANTGTGRTAETPKLDKEGIPVAPAAVAPLSAAALATLEKHGQKDLGPRHARAARKELDPTKDTEQWDALGEKIGQFNQRYENNLAFAESAEKYDQADGKRAELVAQAQKTLKLTAEEAEKFVPKPPVLPVRIYENGYKNSGYDNSLPPELGNFARKFEQLYIRRGRMQMTQAEVDEAYKFMTYEVKDGQRHTFKMSDGPGKPERFKLWHEMSNSQRLEFIENAMNFMQKRHEKFEAQHKAKWTLAPSLFSLTPSIRKVDYYDYGNVTAMPNIGSMTDSKTVDVKEEHQFIRDTMGIEAKSSWLGLRIRYTNTGKIEHLLDEYKGHERAFDRHSERLRKAEPEIKAFGQEVELMNQRIAQLEAGTLTVDKLKQDLNKGSAPETTAAPAPTRSSAADELLAKTREEARDVSAPALPGGNQRSGAGASVGQP